MKMMKR